VLDVAADDLEESWRALGEFLDRARLLPRGRARPADASPLVVERPVLLLANKCDLDADGTFVALAREAVGEALPLYAVSAIRGDGLDALRPILFRELRRVRVHTREPGKKPDPGRPFVLPRGGTVEDLARLVHQDLAAHLKFARIWGKNARFDGQQVDRHHALDDGDVVELHG